MAVSDFSASLEMTVALLRLRQVMKVGRLPYPRPPRGQRSVVRHDVVGVSGCQALMGLSVLSSGKRRKSRSRVSSASTPWATHIAAILASWATPPTTLGRRKNLSSISPKPSVSPISRKDGDAIQASSWRHDCSGDEALSFQMRGLVTTLWNS